MPPISKPQFDRILAQAGDEPEAVELKELREALNQPKPAIVSFGSLTAAMQMLGVTSQSAAQSMAQFGQAASRLSRPNQPQQILIDSFESVGSGIYEVIDELLKQQPLPERPDLPPSAQRNFVPKEARGGKDWAINGSRRPR